MRQQVTKSRNIVISKMLCVPTEHTYNEMYQRSFSLGLAPGEIGGMQDYFYTQGVDKNNQLSMTSAAPALGNVIKLSTTPTGKVLIPHGWGTQRLMFLMAVEEYLSDTVALTHYIQGYSEYYDPSHVGTLDPNANYFINSITTITRTRYVHNNMVDSRVTATYNVVYDPMGGSSYQNVAEPGMHQELIRPTDIMANLYAGNLHANNPDVSLNVRTGSITNGANVSKRNNNDPLRYFTDTVNAVIVGKSINVGHNTPENVLSNANGMVAEQPITNNGFIYELARITGNFEPSSFTLSTLTALDPAVSAKITLVNSGSLVRDPTATTTMLDTHDTESMLNYTEDAEVAQSFINSLTSVMSDNLTTVISGTVTNLHGQPLTTISNIQSFLEGVDITPYGNRIINYVNSVIIPQISINNLRLVSIVFDCDLLGDTAVSISLDNNSPVIFRLPTFADSLYTPILTNEATKEAVLGDFEVLVDTVMGMSPENQTGEYSGY